MNEQTVKCVTLLVEGVMFVALAVLVAMGRDSAITDAMFAVGGTIIGSEIVPTIKRVVSIVK